MRSWSIVSTNSSASRWLLPISCRRRSFSARGAYKKTWNASGRSRRKYGAPRPPMTQFPDHAARSMTSCPIAQLLGNLSAAASEFTLDCNDAIHNPPLVHGNFSPWPGPLHKEDQGNHTQNSSAEEPKIVDVGQHVGLPKQIALH